MSGFLAKSLRWAMHGIGSLLGRPAARVLVYHCVERTGSTLSMTPELFAAQMDWLTAKGYQTWTATRYVAALRAGTRIPREVVVITFDDGLLNNLLGAWPELAKRNMTASLFLVTGNTGAPPRWIERDAERIAQQIREVYQGDAALQAKVLDSTQEALAERIGNWDELRQVARQGFEILSHTHSHPYVDQIAADALRQELNESKAALRNQGLDGAYVIAWPYGISSAAAVRTAQAASVLGAFNSEYYWSHRHNSDLYRLNRIPIDARLGLFGLRFAMGRGYECWAWLRRRRAP